VAFKYENEYSLNASIKNNKKLRASSFDPFRKLSSHNNINMINKNIGNIIPDARK
jgi:hypothetical protein